MIRGMIAAALVAGWAAAAAAAPMDLLFSTEHMRALRPGAELTYGHARHASEAQAEKIGPDLDQKIRLTTGEPAAGATGMAVSVVMDAEGNPRELDTFRGVPGNPILMVFLETTVRAVNRATGGSPFYIRNRIKEGLREDLVSTPVVLSAEGARLAARELRVRPFVDDENAEKLGPFRDLELTFVVAEDVPGMFLSLTAAAGAGEAAAYAEEFRLEGVR